VSRGFVSTLVGLVITAASWFLPWSWPAWPALTLLSIAPRAGTYAGRALFVVLLIIVNTAVWAALTYIVLRGVTMKKFLFVLALFALPLHAAQYEKAIFAGGCFWCTESDFEKIPGVISAVSGYTGGVVKNPSYEQVSAGGTGHRESVEVTFDPSKISYAQLLEHYWHSIDPTDNDGQFCDNGAQYRSAIFYLNASQKEQAEASKAAVIKKLGKAYTDILPAGPFYRAEEYHQQYAKKNPVRYHFYRFNCGRDQRLKEIWGDLAGK
jgi:peptide-methionine (S)-S-oxide reductase